MKILQDARLKPRKRCDSKDILCSLNDELSFWASFELKNTDHNKDVKIATSSEIDDKLQ